MSKVEVDDLLYFAPRKKSILWQNLAILFLILFSTFQLSIINYSPISYSISVSSLFVVVVIITEVPQVLDSMALSIDLYDILKLLAF